MIQKKKAHIITYGCQMNRYDSEVISRILEAEGYEVTEDEECASFILINTCSIRKHAEDKVLSKLGRLSVRKKNTPELRIAVCGCMAQRLGNKLTHRFPEIEFVLGTSMIAELTNILKVNGRDNPLTPLIKGEKIYTGESSCLYPPTVIHENGLKSFVAVILGCDNYCSYCIVPFVRGKPRSRNKIEVIREIEELVRSGCKEITLLGQNILAYGRDINESFSELLKGVHAIDGLMRIRFLTSHPRDLTADLIDIFSEFPKVCEHFHLPVQSGSDHVLGLMGRGYTVSHYKQIVEKIRQKYLCPSITTDLIVGFPGETSNDFDDTMRLVREIWFDTAFCFKYSPREGTPACKFQDQLPEEEKTRRLKELLSVQKDITLQINQAMVEGVQEILLDEKNPREGAPLANDDSLLGRTRGDKVVVVSTKRGSTSGTHRIGDIGMVRIVKADNWSLQGEFVDE
ncbi:MAG: tRNA (N6-isopentenyl adenosine(37)-C2)-methylthiotransferase MiaB [Candidatus Desantisbacteria bacterium]